MDPERKQTERERRHTGYVQNAPPELPTSELEKTAKALATRTAGLLHPRTAAHRKDAGLTGAATGRKQGWLDPPFLSRWAPFNRVYGMRDDYFTHIPLIRRGIPLQVGHTQHRSQPSERSSVIDIHPYSCVPFHREDKYMSSYKMAWVSHTVGLIPALVIISQSLLP